MNAGTSNGIVIRLSLDLSRFNAQMQQARAQMRQLSSMGAGGGSAGARASSFAQGGSNRQPFGNFNNSLGSRIASAFSSTRFNMGRFSPLIGRSMKALGVDAASAAPVLALAGAATQAANALNTFRQNMFTSGGSGMEQARMGGMGGALGLSGAAMAQMSREFAQRITSDPAAAYFAQKAGVRDLPGVFGSVDKARNLLKWIGALSKMPESQAIRAARATGTEGLLPLRDMSPNIRQSLERSAQIQATVFSPTMIRDARDFSGAMAHLNMATQTLVAEIGGPVMAVMGRFANGLANIADWAAGKGATQGGGILDRPGTMSRDAYFKKKAQLDSAKHGDALNANTRAMVENTRAVYRLHEGMSGSGPRTNAAFGKHWGNADVPGKWVGEGFRMGALG